MEILYEPACHLHTIREPGMVCVLEFCAHCPCRGSMLMLTQQIHWRVGLHPVDRQGEIESAVAKNVLSLPSTSLDSSCNKLPRYLALFVTR